MGHGSFWAEEVHVNPEVALALCREVAGRHWSQSEGLVTSSSLLIPVN